MYNQIIYKVLPVVSRDHFYTALRIGLITVVLLSSLLLTGTAFAEPIPGHVGG